MTGKIGYDGKIHIIQNDIVINVENLIMYQKADRCVINVIGINVSKTANNYCRLFINSSKL